MPITLPNSTLFRPVYPKSKDTHVLFGHKYHKVHQFTDKRWLPIDPISQFKYMVTVLGKNVTFKELERNVNNRLEKKALSSLKNQCRSGRLRLRMAKKGNLTRISNILVKHRELKRMYQGLPGHQIVEKTNQRTFLKRKENDRLKYKLKVLMDTYSNRLLEQSKIEDRIKYQNEFILPDEITAKNCRKELANSLTRIKAFKLINRSYQKILETLQRDDIYLEPILNSLEDDIEEQSNFIQQVILIGIPANKKYRNLNAEYQNSEDCLREQLRDNLAYITKYKKQVKDEDDRIKQIVRKNCDAIGEKHNYERETSSMIDLRQNIEEMVKTIKKMKNATYSPQSTDILPKMEKTVLQIFKMEKDLVIENEYKNILEKNEKGSEAMMHLLLHNSSEEERVRLNLIKESENAIKIERANQKAAHQYIVNNGIIFDAFRVSLGNIVEILRHIGSPMPLNKPQYPNEELKLPLINFSHEVRVGPPPPVQINMDLDKLLECAKDKIHLLMVEFGKFGTKDKNYSKLYTKAYLDTLKQSELIFTDRRKSIDFATEKADVNVPTRLQMKLASLKIVGDHQMRQEFFGLV